MTDYDEFKRIRPYLPEQYKILQITEVGSQLWGQGHISSDHDLVVIYQESTIDILSGRPTHSTLPNKHHIIIEDREYDFSYIEIGHFCSQLKKGNVNMIWALMSHLEIYRLPMMRVLYDIINETYTADIVPSGAGMTESQLSDIIKRSDVRSPEKSLNCAYRTISFVVNHLMTKTWDFNVPDCKNITEEKIRTLIDFARTWNLNGDPGHMPTKDIERWLCQLRVSTL